MTDISEADGEVWLPWSEGDDYIISSLGRIRRITQGKYLGECRPIRFRSSRGGLRPGWYVHLSSSHGRRHLKAIHVLVLETFVPRPKSYYRCYPKNGNYDDYRLSNLEWRTCYQPVGRPDCPPPASSDERWRKHPDGLYWVSDKGRIFSIRFQRFLDTKKVGSWKKTFGSNPPKTLARLMLETFVGPKPHPLYVAGHKDRRDEYNHIENLEWRMRDQGWVSFIRQLRKGDREVAQLKRRLKRLILLLNRIPKVVYYADKLEMGTKEVRKMLLAVSSYEASVAELRKEMVEYEL